MTKVFVGFLLRVFNIYSKQVWTAVLKNKKKCKASSKMCKMKNNFNMTNANHNLRISNSFTQRRSQDTLRHLRWISLQQYLKAKNCQLLLQSSASQVFVRIMILLSNPDYVSFFAFFFLQKNYIVFLSYNLIDVRQVVQKI